MNGYCSFYTEGLGLPGSPPDWYVLVNYHNYLVWGEKWFPWNGYCYQRVDIECIPNGGE